MCIRDRVNAKKAKENRENEIASTDNLALLGIAKTLLSRRARVIADPSETDDPDIYKSIVNLSRSRGRWVKHSTAIANQIHNHVDQLFPGFLNPLQTSITPFTEVSLDLMSDHRFSADQFARRKPAALAKILKTRRVNNPEEKARILIELASQALKPNPQHIASQQQTLRAESSYIVAVNESVSSSIWNVQFCWHRRLTPLLPVYQGLG